jgi:hypothetical protein
MIEYLSLATHRIKLDALLGCSIPRPRFRHYGQIHMFETLTFLRWITFCLAQILGRNTLMAA